MTRINQVTPATAKENERLAPIQPEVSPTGKPILPPGFAPYATVAVLIAAVLPAVITLPSVAVTICGLIVAIGAALGIASPGVRKNLFVFALAIGLAIPVAAKAQSWVFDSAQAEITVTCTAGGGSAQSVGQGTYILKVIGEQSAFCVAASASTCASGGHNLSQDFAMVWQQPVVAGASVSCRSTNGNGKVYLSKVKRTAFGI